MKDNVVRFVPIILYGIVFSCTNTATQTGHQANQTVVDTSQTFWALLPFVKADTANPILTPGTGTFYCPLKKTTVSWEEKDVFNPAVAVRNDSLFLLYRAQDKVGKPAGTSRIGLAISTDGIHFTRMPQPVLYPANDAFKKYEWEGGCEDPRLVQDSTGTYFMTYTAFDGKNARLLVASSQDLVHWVKHGPVFAKAFGGKYLNAWSKSGSIVSTYANGKITATKLNGQYWMYWGDKYIWAATSDDLINWQPVEKDTTDTTKTDIPFYGADIYLLKPVLKPRSGKFDSDLVESGPPAMLTPAGIVLLYNGRNITAIGDKQLGEGAYASGQVLLDKANPLKVINRLENNFLKPDKPYEFTGQVNQVCFIEALAQFKSKWWLYYGTADSKIAVATK